MVLMNINNKFKATVSSIVQQRVGDAKYQGICTKCKDWTSVLEPCCDRSVEIEGSLEYYEDAENEIIEELLNNEIETPLCLIRNNYLLHDGLTECLPDIKDTAKYWSIPTARVCMTALCMTRAACCENEDLYTYNADTDKVLPNDVLMVFMGVEKSLWEVFTSGLPSNITEMRHELLKKHQYLVFGLDSDRIDTSRYDVFKVFCNGRIERLN